MKDPNILHEEKNNQGSFYCLDDDIKVAEMNYVRRDGNIVINHTSVDTSLQGKGLGKSLILSAVELARAEGVKVIPVCSYANIVFKRDPAIKDVLG